MTLLKTFNNSFLLILLVILIISCENHDAEDYSFNSISHVNLDLSSLYQNNIIPDSLEIKINTDDNNYSYLFRNLQPTQILELAYNSHMNDVLKIESNLYVNDITRTSNSEYYTNNTNNDFMWSFKSSFYHGNIIFKIDTNPVDNIHVSDFYAFDAREHYFKEYEIPNIDDIADSYLETPMIYLTNHRILYEILDDNMIPLVQYSFGPHYNPVATCSNAFGCYQQYIETNNDQFLDWFFLNVDWIINYRDADSYLKYDFDFNHETQLLEAGWTSAMAQGQALALMCMAYHNTKDDKYLGIAEDFFVTMCRNFNGNWNLMIDEEDYLWYEEYPSPDFCHVLNGKLFSMWGLWDYYCLTREKDALHLFQGGIASVIDNYPIWDIDGIDGSHYCCHTSCLTSYHEVHKNQLAVYRDMFNIQAFDMILLTFTNQRSVVH